MKRRIKTGFLVLSMAVLLSACGQTAEEKSTTAPGTEASDTTAPGTSDTTDKGTEDSTSGGGTTESQTESTSTEVDEDAPEHDQLMAKCRSYMDRANELEDVGNVLTAEYLRGYAQAEVSSLRLCIDTILWLMGEGDSLSDVIGEAQFKKWDDIVGAGLGNEAPFYFEGLLFEIQGEKEKAEEGYQKAEMNPGHEKRDFYYLRHMSVEELKRLREKVYQLECDISDQYTPRTELIRERTGAEFAPAFHLALMKENEDSPTKMFQCAVNALLTNPTDPSLYSVAVTAALNAGKAEEAYEYINDGLFLFRDDAELNYLAALFAASAEKKDEAKEFLTKAKADETADEELKAKIQALSEQIGE